MYSWYNLIGNYIWPLANACLAILEQVHYLVSRWGSDPNSLGCYAYDVVGMPEDLYERLQAPLGSIFFGGEAVSMDHQGSVHGAYSAGVMAAQNCQKHLLKQLGNLEMLQLVSYRHEIRETAFPLQISRMWNAWNVGSVLCLLTDAKLYNHECLSNLI